MAPAAPAVLAALAAAPLIFLCAYPSASAYPQTLFPADLQTPTLCDLALCLQRSPKSLCSPVHLIHTPESCSWLAYDCGPAVSWATRGCLPYPLGCNHTFSNEFSAPLSKLFLCGVFFLSLRVPFGVSSHFYSYSIITAKFFILNFPCLNDCVVSVSWLDTD